jgi:LPXTG-motif cell wall-anchored protein
MWATRMTTALDHGASLEDVQSAAGHADPSTTKLSDRRGDNPEQAASFFAHDWHREKEGRGMQSTVGMALLVVGVVLIIFGMQASASLSSRLSELFTGAPSDRTIWLLLAGVVAAILGLGLLLIGRRKTP